MRVLLILFSFVVLSSCSLKTTKEEQVIFDRIVFIYNLKSTINEAIWKDFDLKKFDLPLIYYTSSTSYIVNPTLKFLDQVKSDLVFENRKVKIYKTKKILDSVHFHMHTGLTLGDSTGNYDYKSPFMNCSSLEITRTVIPGVNSTEQWATMVLHEYFHGYQYKHNNYLVDFEKHAIEPEDSLRHLYSTNKWFKERIIKENDLLLKALSCKDKLETRKLLIDFFSLRKERRLRVQQTLNKDIAPMEKIYETMEGTARYIEHGLFNSFAYAKVDPNLVVSDTAFHSFDFFKNYKIEKCEWLYKSGSVSYFYASGFNISRLLDKLAIEYKSRLFNNAEVSLEQILEEWTIGVNK